MPQFQDEVTWRSETYSDDLSTSGTRKRRQVWNLEREHPCSAVPPNILKAESKRPEWSDPPAWPPEELGTANTLELHRFVRTYSLGLTATLWWGWTTDKQTNGNGDQPHNMCHYLVINAKPLILSNCRCGARPRERCRNIWWRSDSNDRDIGSWRAFEDALNITPDSKSMKIILHCESPCSVIFSALELKI